jgi:hypothetical protein
MTSLWRRLPPAQPRGASLSKPGAWPEARGGRTPVAPLRASVLLLLGLALAGCGLRGASKPAAAPAGGRPSAAPARRSGSVASTATGGSVSGSTGSGGAAGTVQAPATPAPRPGPLPYPILIADRGNSRILEVTPDKRIVWSFPAPGGLPAGQAFVGGDDSFFTPGGAQIISNEEENGTIAIIDYASRQIVWQYGHPGVEDAGPGFLNYPDDAYELPDGTVIVADIRNCRELFIDQQMQVVQQWGKPASVRTTRRATCPRPTGTRRSRTATS